MLNVHDSSGSGRGLGAQHRPRRAGVVLPGWEPTALRLGAAAVESSGDRHRCSWGRLVLESDEGQSAVAGRLREVGSIGRGDGGPRGREGDAFVAGRDGPGVGGVGVSGEGIDATHGEVVGGKRDLPGRGRLDAAAVVAAVDLDQHLHPRAGQEGGGGAGTGDGVDADREPYA